ncbi:matrix extracellular phosphoglycoprotein isoform X2 [Tenrec ecaudatus]|uniref:matrix extracellular phosphoglycoprotein isoform X2 n=1 Tax=Tenrec ecaudatus TaxID=94439 RepID=UPI003F5A88A2
MLRADADWPWGTLTNFKFLKNTLRRLLLKKNSGSLKVNEPRDSQKMQLICLGMFLFSLAWAAPLTYKGHHEKHGYYVLKCVDRSPGRKTQTDLKQEERSKDGTAIHHLGKRKKQEPPPEKSTESRKYVPLLEANGIHQSRKSQTLFANRQTGHEDHSTNNTEDVDGDRAVSLRAASSPKSRAGTVADALRERDREAEGEAHPGKGAPWSPGPGAVLELPREEDKEKKGGEAPRPILRGVHNAEASPKYEKTLQRDAQAPNRPVQGENPRHVRDGTDFLQQLTKLKTLPRDFEGSGSLHLRRRGDKDVGPFSGDGQPFEDIPGHGEGPDIGRGESERTHPDRRGSPYNEVPEKGGASRNAIGSGDPAAPGSRGADVRLVKEGADDILGRTDLPRLPGQGGHRVDSGSRNAHGGGVELLYPGAPSKGKCKENCRDMSQSTNDNEIPKHGKSGTRKGAGHSHRNQVTSNEEQKLPGKRKSQGPRVSSDRRNEIGSYKGPAREENRVAHNDGGRRLHAAAPWGNNAARGKAASGGNGSWEPRRPHSNRSRDRRRQGDSSESSEGDSSSSSEGD